MNYQKFKADFEKSGLTQRAYSEQKSMSSSMVSYYLRRAREQSNQKQQGQFQEVKIQNQSHELRHIRITTSDGLEISIPI